MTNEPKLAPCPFCGATPHKQLGKVWHDSLHGDKHQDTIIKCPHLCASMSGSADTVVKRWNTRDNSHALALVAEAYEVAGDAAADAYDANDLPTGSDMAGFIRSLTPADAQAARDARDAEVWNEAIRKAAALIGVKVGHGGDIGNCGCGRCCARRDDHAEILALIEKDKTNDG